MWKLLRNKKLASSLGFLILIALIWFIGPWLGLATQESRLLWIVVVMLVWVVSLLIGKMISDRAGNLLEKVLRRQTDEAVIGADPEQRREVAQLRQRLLGAIDTLKTSKLGKVSGKAALYELPWYMIIGHSAAGKSSAIQHSSLDFPFGDKQAIQGVGGTRNCDWFFTTDGVLLDTAGRYSTQREDRGEWLEFLKLLKKYRSKAPSNGIIVALSFPELIQHQGEQFSLYARQVRERINEIDDAFGIKVPIYLVFTKMDLLGGFAQFFEDFSEEERQGVWGATLSHDQGAAFDAARVVGQQFDALHRGLVQMGFDKLAHNRGNINRPALFAFPIEFHALREPICKFVDILFQEDPFHSKPLLRGFYFTSALQEGEPQQAASNRISKIFSLARPGFNAARPPVSNSFFLRDLFREVIFPDHHLITRQTRSSSGHWRFAGMLAGLSSLALLSGMLTWSYVGNQKLVSSAQEELLVARKLNESGELVDRLKGLQVLQLRLEQLYQYRKEGHPFKLGMGLYQGEELERTLRREYFTGVRAVMLMPVKAALEERLGSLGKAPPPPPPAAKPEAPPAPPKAAPKAPSGGGLPYIPILHRPQQFQGGFFKAAYTPGTQAFVLRTATPAGAANPTPPVMAPKPTAAKDSQQHLEEGYNALKTYLMLKHQERMDMPHLADQLPKYWRPWLEQHKGRGQPDEVNRLAERVVAFYVSQLAEEDLPLIENREDLVGQSRETLRAAFQRLSAVERVYNELKVRANTQFAPMTVGRMLNSRDLNLIAGSSSLPGAFTREAWEKYLREAFLDASKGEVKGDDWVLATSSLDNLSQGGNVERNREELEQLYKAEYAREWQKFLQGIVIQEFGNMDHAAQSLGRLADLQNSSLRALLTKAAYETSWDNPSQLSKTLENAKNSVLERTEKLVLGTSTPPGTPPASQQLGELGAQFALLAALTNPGEGGRPPLAAYLEALGKLKTKLALLAANPDPGPQARQLMQATLSGSGSEFAEALALVDGPLLSGHNSDATAALRPLLLRPLIQAYATLIPPVEQDINQAWRTDVLPAWQALANKYPFADTANEASMAEIAKFLKPGDGTLSAFVDKQLAGLVVRRGDQLTPRTWANMGVGFSPAFLSGVSRLSAAGRTVLQEGDNTRFELQPVPTPGLSEIMIELDGQALRYRNGPQLWTVFSWPGGGGNLPQGARIQAIHLNGAPVVVANHGGRLGFMRLLAQARVSEGGNGSKQLEWRMKRPDGVEAEAIRFNFRLVSGANPLSLSELRRLGLPDKVTH